MENWKKSKSSILRYLHMSASKSEFDTNLDKTKSMQNVNIKLFLTTG